MRLLLDQTAVLIFSDVSGLHLRPVYFNCVVENRVTASVCVFVMEGEGFGAKGGRGQYFYKPCAVCQPDRDKGEMLPD